MSLSLNTKVAFIAVTSAILALTGCSTKANKSQVSVSPLGMYGSANGSTSNNGYNGGSLVNNNANVAAQAQGLQSTVYFNYDSSNLGSQASTVLNQHASLLTNNSGSRILVVGHTDPRGSREYNMALGERRAQAVRTYLSSKGVDTNNIEVTSRGEEELAAEGASEAAYAKNRRAVLSY